MRELTTRELIFGVLQSMLTYNLIEVVLAIALSITYYCGVGVWPLVLWSGFILSASYVISTSLNYAQEFAKEQVLGRDIFITDFFSGAVILCVLAWIVRHEDWQFSVMFLLAAAQHFRYTCLSLKWLLDEKEANEHPKDKM